jgi:hypothetical protein
MTGMHRAPRNKSARDRQNRDVTEEYNKTKPKTGVARPGGKAKPARSKRS